MTKQKDRPESHKEWLFWSHLKVKGRYIERIPFSGLDKVQGIDYCCICKVGHGENHRTGCPKEQCPECGKVVADCLSEGYIDDDNDDGG